MATVLLSNLQRTIKYPIPIEISATESTKESNVSLTYSTTVEGIPLGQLLGIQGTVSLVGAPNQVGGHIEQYGDYYLGRKDVEDIIEFKGEIPYVSDGTIDFDALDKDIEACTKDFIAYYGHLDIEYNEQPEVEEDAIPMGDYNTLFLFRCNKNSVYTNIGDFTGILGILPTYFDVRTTVSVLDNMCIVCGDIPKLAVVNYYRIPKLQNFESFQYIEVVSADEEGNNPLIGGNLKVWYDINSEE